MFVIVVERPARTIATAVLVLIAAPAGSARRRRRLGNLADEVTSELVDQLPEGRGLVRVPAVEALPEAVGPGGDYPLVVLAPGVGQLDRATAVPLDKHPLFELFQRLGQLERVDRKLLAELGLGQGCTLAQARQQPQLRGRKVETGTRREPLVQLPALLAPGEPRQSTLDLAECLVVVGGVQSVAGIRRAGGRLERHLGQEPREQKAEESDAGGDHEHRRQRVGDCDLEWITEDRRELLDDSRVRRRGWYMRTGREFAREIMRELVGEDGAEDGDPDRAADLAKERRPRAGDAEVLVVDGVLGRQDEHLDD